MRAGFIISFLCEESYNCLVIAVVDMCNDGQKYHVKKRQLSQRILGTCSNFIIVQFGTIVFVTLEFEIRCIRKFVVYCYYYETFNNYPFLGVYLVL
jgi:hypothetical protein